MSMRSATRVGRGSLNGTLEKRQDERPGLRGSIAFESDVTIRAGQHLHIVGWIREVRGIPFVSLVVESDLASSTTQGDQIERLGDLLHSSARGGAP